MNATTSRLGGIFFFTAVAILSTLATCAEAVEAKPSTQISARIPQIRTKDEAWPLPQASTVMMPGGVDPKGSRHVPSRVVLTPQQALFNETGVIHLILEADYGRLKKDRGPVRVPPSIRRGLDTPGSHSAGGRPGPRAPR
jgi:hypothetical protein